MADDVTVDTITGNPVIATDDDGARQHQWIKLKFGPADTFTIVENGVGLPVAPFSAILEVGSTQIIGINDAAMTINEYSSTADLSLAATLSGEILGFTLTAAGVALQHGKSTVIFLDADPATTSGDTALSAAEHLTVLASVKIAADEWEEDANGAIVTKTVAIPFHALGTIYCVYKTTDATATWNSAGGDDESLFINMWYRRDS